MHGKCLYDEQWLYACWSDEKRLGHICHAISLICVTQYHSFASQYHICVWHSFIRVVYVTINSDTIYSEGPLNCRALLRKETYVSCISLYRIMIHDQCLYDEQWLHVCLMNEKRLVHTCHTISSYVWHSAVHITMKWLRLVGSLKS